MVKHPIPKGVLKPWHELSKRLSHQRLLQGTLHHRQSVLFRLKRKELTEAQAAGELKVSVRTIRRIVKPESASKIAVHRGSPARLYHRCGKYHDFEKKLVD